MQSVLKRFSSICLMVPLVLTICIFIFLNAPTNVIWFDNLINNINEILIDFKANLGIADVNIYIDMSVNFLILSIPFGLTYICYSLMRIIYDLPNKM